MCRLLEANILQWWVNQLEIPKGNQTVVGNLLNSNLNISLISSQMTLQSIKLNCLISGEDAPVASILHNALLEEMNSLT